MLSTKESIACNLATTLKSIKLFASNIEYNTKILFSDNTSTFMWMLVLLIPLLILTFGLILSYRKFMEIKNRMVRSYIPMNGESMNYESHLAVSSKDTNSTEA